MLHHGGNLCPAKAVYEIFSWHEIGQRSAPAQCLQCQALLMKMGRWVSAPRQRGQYRNLGALGMMISVAPVAWKQP